MLANLILLTYAGSTLGGNNVTDQIKTSELVHEAYNAVKDLAADDSFKLAGFKIVLASLLGAGSGAAPISGNTNTAQTPDSRKPAQAPVDDADWAGKIAQMLDITVDQVAEVYYYDGEQLKLLINRKQLPDTASASTQDVAALITAGRQALGLDMAGTDFEIIKDSLLAYNVFNAKNWTGYIKSLGNKFLYEGTGKHQTIKLTNKAYDEAAKVAHKYLEASE
jgi:hypothetical protein